MFLTNRQQQVRIGHTLSAKEWVRSGVPQGSVLGPLLFLIMLVDIDADIKHSMLGSYADDTRLWKFIHRIEDQELLQQDLQVLYDWADYNNKKYNDDKFEHLPHGPENSRIYVTQSGSQIKKKNTVKDLGVYMSHDCSFNFHIANTVKTAFKVSAWILRTFLTRDKFLMKILLQSLVVSQVEYASVVWSPFDSHNINMLENVQRRFTSKIFEYQTWDDELQKYICEVDYVDRLKDLKIYSLDRRRERFMILYAYRVIIGLIQFQWFEAYEDHEEQGIKLRPKYNKKAPQYIRRARHSSFFYKGPQLYNLMPAELRQFEEIVEPDQSHVDEFKKKLDKYLEMIPDEPTVPDRQRAAATNSLICQIPMFRKQHPEAS